MGEICVVVDNHRLEPLLDDTSGAVGSLRLTTIEPGQQRAMIEIRSRRDDLTATLYTLEVADLPKEKPHLEVRGRLDSSTLSLEFLLQNKVFHRAKIKLPVSRRLRWCPSPG